MRGLLVSILSIVMLLPSLAGAARIKPATMEPLIAPGYEAEDVDERGLWQISDKLETELAKSSLLVRDEILTGYLQEIMNRLLGDAAADIRLYVVRNPDFNASMFPNGMMIVHTGLLARMRNEAQLAAVLGHEAGHYLRRHSIQRWRSIKTKTAVMSVFSVAGAAATGASGNNWYDLANAINTGLLLSIFSYSRVQEQEADAYGLKLLVQAGYTPHAAANIWTQVIEERKASAEARNKYYNDRSRSLVSTHPPTESRLTDLKLSAEELLADSPETDASRTNIDMWNAGMAPVHWSVIDEQVKLNDPGASLYLINALAESGWNSELHYFLGEIYNLRGQEGDSGLAAEAYAAAVNYPEPVPEALRAHGYAQLKKGNKAEAHEALARYLALRPDAVDAAMVRFTIGQ